jgi:hypothetical protein
VSARAIIGVSAVVAIAAAIAAPIMVNLDLLLMDFLLPSA